MLRILVIIFTTLVLALIGRCLAFLIPISGTFANLQPLLVEQCRAIDIAPGTEDVTIDPELGVAFISAADRRAWYN